MKKLNKKGFTITELVIVIAVIAILSAVLIPTFTGVVKDSKDSAAVQDAKNAYTQYLYDYALAETDEEAYENFIYKYDENRCVVILNGDLVKENDSVKLYKEADAIAYLKTQLSLVEDNTETPDNEQNYTTEDIEPIKFIAYAKK